MTNDPIRFQQWYQRNFGRDPEKDKDNPVYRSHWKCWKAALAEPNDYEVVAIAEELFNQRHNYKWDEATAAKHKKYCNVVMVALDTFLQRRRDG